VINYRNWPATYSTAAIDAVRSANFDASRQKVFKYGLFADKYSLNGERVRLGSPRVSPATRSS
jgi:hypothetical protein